MAHSECGQSTLMPILIQKISDLCFQAVRSDTTVTLSKTYVHDEAFCTFDWVG